MKKQKPFVLSLVFGLTLLASLLISVSHTSAAATITVNNADDNSTGGNGQCTLREAINNANSDSDTTSGDCTAGSGTDTINFNISSGGTTFTEQTKTGYTIKPTSALPAITGTTIINGYSQPNSQANTAVSPNPINSIILVEIDGSLAGNSNGLNISGSNSEVKGLVINKFAASGMSGVAIGGNGIKTQGCFLGTEPDGMTAAANHIGHVQSADNSTDAVIGGLNPADRNIISGNASGGSSPNTGSNNWTYQGNYLGVGRDGITVVANSGPGLGGALSLDNSSGHVVGGSETGAINVISGNLSHGIAPANSNNTRIEGNYIGVAYNGTTQLGNGAGGISVSGSTGITVKNNTIAKSTSGGLLLGSGSNNAVITGNTIIGGTTYGISVDASDNPTITSNTIQSNAQSGIQFSAAINGTVKGNSILSNAKGGSPLGGLLIVNSTSISVGSSSTADRNIISDNGGDGNVFISGFGATTTNVKIQGNYIGVDSTASINGSYTKNTGVLIQGTATANLIGGTGAGEGNIIAGGSGAGVAVARLFVAPATEAVPTNNAIIGNSIYGNENAGKIRGLNTAGSGIDLNQITLDGSFNPSALVNDGFTVNDAGDSDTGPNGYLNFPVVNSTVQNGTAVSINYNLDALATDSTPNNSYRVEFFTSTAKDSTGYGEGQTYLGSVTTSNGSNQTANITIPSNIDLTGKYITATTTAVQTGISSGFGATSEFSLASNNITVQSAHILTYIDPVKGTTVTLDLPSGTSNPTFSGMTVNGLPADGSNSFPVGIANFQFNVTAGATKLVTLYFDLPGDASSYVARKYNTTTKKYSDVAGATIERVTYNGKSQLKLSYNITDGGVLDQDGTANGTIIDPVGLALKGNLANTGADAVGYTLIAGALIIVGGCIVVRRYHS